MIGLNILLVLILLCLFLILAHFLLSHLSPLHWYKWLLYKFWSHGFLKIPLGSFVFIKAWIDLTSSSSPLGTCIYTHTDTCLHIKTNLQFGYFPFSSLRQILVHTWISCRVGAQLAEDEESSPLFCPPCYRCAIRSTLFTSSTALCALSSTLTSSHGSPNQRDFFVLLCFVFLNLKHWRVRLPFFFSCEIFLVIIGPLFFHVDLWANLLNLNTDHFGDFDLN